MKRPFVFILLLSIYGITSTSFAQEHPDIREAFNRLIERGLAIEHNIDVTTMNNQIPEGDLEAVKLFIQVGINPNVRDSRGRLPLLVAAEEGQAEIAKTLLEAGADPALTDRHGRTPEEIAYLRGHDNVVRVFQTTFPKPPEWVLSEPTNFGESKVLFHSNLYAALEDAVAHHEGDLLIYFYRAERRDYQNIEHFVFGSDEISEYIKENFATLAVEIGSDTWLHLMGNYYPNSAIEHPFVLVDIRRSLSHKGYHGWENARVEADLSDILQQLKRDKAASRNL